MQSHLASVPARAAALRTLVASVGVTALLGIWALLVGDFGKLQIKILLSSLSVSAASLCALAGAAALERSGGRRALPVAAITLAAVGLVLCLIGVWSEHSSEPFWQLTAIVCICAVGCAHASVLGLARLLRRYQWVGNGTVVTVLSLAAYGSGLVIFEPRDDNLLRVLGALSIAVAAGTIATPVLHRLSRDERAPAPDGEAADAVDLLCPACGRRLRARLGDVQCPGCQARFRIELRPSDRPS